MNRLLVLVAGVGLLAAVTACGGASTGETDTKGPDAAAPAAADSTADPTTTQTSPPAAQASRDTAPTEATAKTDAESTASVEAAAAAEMPSASTDVAETAESFTITESGESASVTTDASPAPAAGATESTEISWEDPRPAERGHNVGDFATEFTMKLADGSKVALVDLVSESQPAFLFFFAKW